VALDQPYSLGGLFFDPILIVEHVGMKPDTVVILNDFGHVNGGASSVALAEAEALARTGCPVLYVYAVAPVDPRLSSQTNIRVICTNQEEIVSDPDRVRAATQGLWNRRAAALLGAVLTGLEPKRTIIHLHGWTKALSSSVARAALDRGFKVVCTVHDYFLACPNGGFFHYQEQKICKLKALSLPCLATRCDARSYPQKLWRFSRGLVQKIGGRLPGGIRHFIAVSDFSREVIAPYLPEGSKINRINNPVEVARGLPVKVTEQSTFMAAGRLSPEKGCVQFARAAQTAGAPAVFVGEGVSRNEILAANSQAVITGWLRHDQVLEELQHARALVFPSLLYEAQPLVIMEAAALGIPSLVPDTSAARELVVDGQTGLWFRSGCVEDLTRKIQMLFDDELVKYLGQKAYERYWNSPKTVENHVEQLLNVYQDILLENRT